MRVSGSTAIAADGLVDDLAGAGGAVLEGASEGFLPQLEMSRESIAAERRFVHNAAFIRFDPFVLFILFCMSTSLVIGG